MSENNPLDSSLEKLSRERLAVLVKSLQGRLREQEQKSREPIAIVGAACRFPGAPDLNHYWEVLHHGKDAVTNIPGERWDVDAYFDPAPETPGKMYTKAGGFIHNPTHFDSAFFGISRREAISMDPQQRLLLEIAWESLENAGIPAKRLRESDTGVFVGISTNDYLQLGCLYKEREQMDAYHGTGSAASIAAGRISYLLGLQGPTMAIDTACSSSLVALHLACNAIRNGECQMALVGGVNLMLSPDSTIYFCRVRALSTEGRCKSFSADADGYVRGEGCGFVVLKRLSDALKDKDNIMAVVRGSAVNHDGRTTGLTVPNTASQVKLLRSALQSASITADEVDYIEAHGTGTPLGDPIELNALSRVYESQGSRRKKLWIGSAKTNIGHLEAAAGVAGLIKVILAMQHREVPRSLHFDQPNPNFNWRSSNISVATSSKPWEGDQRIATVSSFGFSGTNANVVVQSADEYCRHAEASSAEITAGDRSSHVVCVSAKSEAAVREFASACSATWSDSTHRLSDIGYSLNAKRDHFDFRHAIATNDLSDLLSQLRSVASGESRVSRCSSSPLRIGFLFTGQGAQYAGMGRSLYQTAPVFRDSLDRCAALWEQIAPSEPSLLEIMFGVDESVLQQTRYTQSCLFAYEYALGELWRSWGVQPAAVMGHSVGEIAAACHCGLITLEMGFSFAVQRGQLMGDLPGKGIMVAVRASHVQARQWTESFPGVSLAADNGPQSVVMSGLQSDVEPLLAHLRSIQVPFQPLQVSHAFHSLQVEPVMQRLKEITESWCYLEPSSIFVSNLLGSAVGHHEMARDYWADHARQCVRFRQGVETLVKKDIEVFVEIGPQPTLIAMAMQGAHAPGLQWLPSVRRQGDDWGQLTKTIAALYTAGVDIDWVEFDRPYQRRAVAYPNYPFQRSRLQETATKQPTERAPDPVVRPAVSIPDDTAPPIEENSFPVFELEWVQRSVAGMAATGNRHWLVIGNDPLANSLSSSLVKLGDEVQQLDLKDAERGVSANAEGSTDSRVVDWIQEQCERFANVDGVIFTSSLDCRARDQDLPIALQELLHLVQSLSSTGRELSQRLWVLTRGAAPIATETIDDAAAMIWGMVQTVSVEVRQLRPACIDLDNESDIQQDVESVLGCLNARDSETHIAIRGDKRLVQRLVRVEPPNTVTKNSIRPDASYLVTGGLGGVGVCVAKWLCEQGARSVHLVSRRDPDDELKDELNQWARKHHSEVRFHRADVSIRADVDRVIQGIESDGKPLAGLLHLAGAHRDGALVNLSWDDFLFTAQSKVSGALHLHEATQSLPLDWFVAFSSVASVVGSPGQANYAASNAFLDSLMHSRRKKGLPGLSLNWGPWDEVGMAAQLPASKKRRWEAMGVSMIQPEQGLQLLSKLIAGDSTQSVVVPADWSKMLCLFPPGLEPPLLENFIDANRQLSDPSPQWQQLKQKALQVPVNRRSELVARFVEALVRDVLDMPSEEPLDRTAGFADLGMDSLMGVELRNHLQQHLGTEMTLTATVAFNYPNVATLSEYLAKEVLHARVASPQVALNRDRNTSHEPIAIVGCALRFPGGINDLDSYWQLLQTGGIAVEEIPDSRWQVSEYYDPDPDRPGYMNTRWAGLMDDLDKFDASFFGISPREAAKMDPQHRIVLETVWSALENGCIPPRSIFGTKTAVFLGISGNDYVSRLSRASAREDIDAYLAAGNAQHVAAGRISHFFGLHGPSIALDTACSSSLVAVHLAHESLQSGESELAVAGGVNVLLAPEISISLSKAHMMAKDGRCKTFSDAADGYVRSEGCGFIVMKRLSDAQRDGNRIFALVRGSCVNHDGRCSAVTVPNGDSQQMLVRQALKNASLTPDSIDYVETHGTGTSLGDPIEVDALGNVFSDRLSTDRLILGSVKANLGHLESAAGIAGLLKVLAMLRHGQFPPQPPFERLNSHVDWENSCVQVSRELMAWPRIENETRYAGVSSFSFGGTNAHVVLSDPPLKSDPVDYPEARNNDAAHTQLVVLSAKSESALNRQVDRLVDSLTDQSLSDVAFTLAAGRDPLNHRIAIMATSIEQLAAGLRDYRQDGGHHAVSYRSIRGSHIPDIGLLLCNLAAFDEERVDPLLASCPQVALDYAAETKAFFDIGDLELSATQEKAARWTILQAVLAGHAMRWFSDAPTLAGYGVGRYASLAASGLIRPCEAARLSVMHIAAAERLLKNAGDVLLLVAGDASNALLRLPADRSIVCVPTSQLNELENVARQRGQIFDRLGTEFCDLIDVRIDPAFRQTLDSMTSRDPEHAVADLHTCDLVSSLASVFESSGLPSSIDSFPRILGGQDTLVLSAAMEQWEQRYGASHPRDGRLIDLGKRDLPPLLCWMRECYLSGLEIDWRAFYGSGFQWIDLPTYPFAKESHWFGESKSTRLLQFGSEPPDQHPYIGVRLRGPTIKETVFQNRLTPNHPRLLQDHKIYDMVVVPGAFHLAAVLAASREEGGDRIEMSDVMFPEALVLQEDVHRAYQLSFSMKESAESDFQTFRVFSELQGSDRWSLHCEGKRRCAQHDPQQPVDRVDVKQLQQSFSGMVIQQEWFYDMMAQHGIQLGNSFRWMTDIYRGERSALAKLSRPDKDAVADSILPPGLIDCCFQILAACLEQKDIEQNAYIPVKIRNAIVYRSIDESGWLHATIEEPGNNSTSFVGNLKLVDDHGDLIAEFLGVTVRKAPRTTLMRFAQRQTTDIFYKVRWSERSLPPVSTAVDCSPTSSPQPELSRYEVDRDDEALPLTRYEGGLEPVTESRDASASASSQMPSRNSAMASEPWLVIADEQSPLSDITREILTSGQQLDFEAESDCELSGTSRIFSTCAVERNCVDGSRSCLAALERQFVEKQSLWSGLVWIPPVMPHSIGSEAESFMEGLQNCFGELLETIQFLGRQKLNTHFHLVLVTTLGLPLESQGQQDPAIQMLMGFCNVIRNEYPQLHCIQIDLEDNSSQSVTHLVSEIESISRREHDGENVIGYRDSKRFTPRLNRLLPGEADLNAVDAELDLSIPYRLVPNRSGILSALTVTAIDRRQPGPGQIEIQVMATGLNFRDVLNALSLYPGDAGPLGLECTGMVTAVGKNVSWPAVGARVVALAPASFSQYVLTDARLVAEAPSNLTDEEAAGIPVTHLTADAAIRRLAQLKPDESILIHAGAGGVGLAAIDMALRIGAKVYATAGSPEKRSLLQVRGVTQVFDSRSTAFAEELLHARHGKGVDVILNSLAGDMIDASFRVLSPTGRFVEIGKIGIWSPEKVAEMLPDASYHIYALDEQALSDPQTVGDALRVLTRQFEEDLLGKPRTTSFEMKHAKQAFQYMAQAKHMGKVVVTHPAPDESQRQIRSNAGYLITGGLGGVGLVVANWLAEQRAGRIVLVSRHQPDLSTQHTIDEIRKAGCDIRVASANITDFDQVQLLVDQFDSSAPLKGIIHAAGVLDDGPLAQMPWKRFVPVLEPKVIGALNLHRLTQDSELDFFVMFSSIAAVLGSPGQGNYATANAFLDALAIYRRSEGLAATSINWGPWRDVGMATKVNAIVKHQWERSGLSMLTNQQCLFALERLMLGRDPQVIVTSSDWSKLGQHFAKGTEPPLLRELISDLRVNVGPSERWLKLIGQIEKTPVPQRLNILIEFMCCEARLVLNLPSDHEIDASVPFNEHGFDSLMAVELANRLAAESGTSLPATLLFDHPTLESLAKYILTDVYKLLPKQEEAPAPVRRKSVDELTADLLKEIESMSDQEIDEQLS